MKSYTILLLTSFLYAGGSLAGDNEGSNKIENPTPVDHIILLDIDENNPLTLGDVARGFGLTPEVLQYRPQPQDLNDVKVDDHITERGAIIKWKNPFTIKHINPPLNPKKKEIE